MKILHVLSGDLWAGAESQAFTLMTNLVLLPDISVTAVLFNEGVLAGRLRIAGIGVYIISEENSNIYSILIELYRIIRNIRPDIVHTHRFKENVLGSLAAAGVWGVKSVRTMHGAPEHLPRNKLDLRRRLVGYLDRWCGRHLQKAVIVVSTDLAARFSGSFGKTPLIVVKNGIDARALREKSNFPNSEYYSSGKRRVGFVGRLVAVKRVDLFLEVAVALKAKLGKSTPTEFHIFGDGPLMASLVEYSRRLHLDDSVKFHGHNPSVSENIAGLDVLVICSDYEGMPMVALEALALGTKVVAHRVGGLGELLPDECLVDEQDSSAYADKIHVELLKGRDPRKQDSLPREYTASLNASSVREIYCLVVSGRRPHSSS